MTENLVLAPFLHKLFYLCNYVGHERPHDLILKIITLEICSTRPFDPAELITNKYNSTWDHLGLNYVLNMQTFVLMVQDH